MASLHVDTQSVTNLYFNFVAMAFELLNNVLMLQIIYYITFQCTYAKTLKIVAKRSAEENVWDPICTKFRANGILFVVNRGNNATTPNLFCRLLLFFRVCEK